MEWAIDLFRSHLQVAIFEEVAEDDVNKLASELDSLEVEKELRIGKMKIDKKTKTLDFIASISKDHSNLFLASALPALPKE